MSGFWGLEAVPSLPDARICSRHMRKQAISAMCMHSHWYVLVACGVFFSCFCHMCHDINTCSSHSLTDDLVCIFIMCCLHTNVFLHPRLAMQRYNYAERVATCIDDYVQSSRRGGSRGGKSGGGKSLDGGASADTGEAFSTGETVGWGCPRVRCVSSCSDIRLWEYYLCASIWIGMMDQLAWPGVHRFCLCRKPQHGISRCGAYLSVCSGLTIFFLTIITNTTTTTE